MTTSTRRRLLTTGAAGGLALLTGSSVAGAAAPKPTPVDDDLAYLQIASVGKLVSITLFDRALRKRGLVHGDARAMLRAIRADEIAHRRMIDAALGADAPQPADYTVTVPSSVLSSEDGVAQFGLRIEVTTRNAVLGGAAQIEDPATRDLLIRIVAVDTAHLAMLGQLRGVTPRGGKLPANLTLERAADRLDPYLTVDAPDALRRLSPSLRRNFS
jgi:hypothetical protein